VTPADSRVADSPSRWAQRFADAVRFLLAPLLLFISGFSTADFLLSGAYTWPRTSRVLVLTITVIVLAYEFVYKEHLARVPDGSRAMRTVLYSCVLPYVLGVAALLALAKM